ncbi:MAG: DUF3394 domain-containing protein, partial [Gammaproteobacteria bacterium]|nr:DUF3394 domain-containing protein [Gammaproteobacteria bacterium]
FLFIFNTELLLIGIDNWFHLVGVIISATIAMLLFAAATQGYWLVKSRLWESLAILLVAFTLFRPGFWWDEIYPPTETLSATQIIERAGALPKNGKLNMMVSGETLDGKLVEKLVRLPLGKPGAGEDRLREAGLEVRIEDGKVLADNVMFGSDAQQVGLDFDWEIVNLQVDADIPPKHIMFIPALALLGLVAWLQLRRKAPTSPAPQTA